MNMKSELERYKDDFIKQKDTYMYQNHCDKFLSYLNEVGRDVTPVDVSTDDVIASVGYYNKRGKINTFSTMTNHLEAIKAFYDFLQRKRLWSNIFNTLPAYDEFKKEIAKRFSLSDTIEREYLPINVIIDLLIYFDNEVSYDNNKMMMIKIFTKIMLIAPAKRNVICNIKFQDFDDDFRILTVNNVQIRIPNSLRRDIKGFIKYTSKEFTKNSGFFEYLYCNKFSHNIFNEPLYTALASIDYDVPPEKNTFSVEAIMNTAIVSMIHHNVNPLLISKINGVKLQQIGEKVDKYGVEVNNYSELINSAIMGSDYYTYI